MMLSFRFLRYLLTIDFSPWRPSTIPPIRSKSVAIVGAGSAGLAALKTFLDLPAEVIATWDINLYDEREDVGGTWLPDPFPRGPPQIPFTALYPDLHTNTPVPMMTYPHFPFAAGTPLYPSHEHIQSYHRRYVAHFKLLPHIKFRHTVVSSSWVGDQSNGVWNMTFIDPHNQTRYTLANHLIVASGNNHVPRTPTWSGQDQWLERSRVDQSPREITHSIYYRHPEKYRNRTLLIIGSSASGQDIAVQTSKVAKNVYLSARHQVALPPGAEDVLIKPDVSHLTPNSIVFVDGSELHEVDAVLLATGYEVRKSFLEAGNALVYDRSARSNLSSITKGGRLIGNQKYIFPLHRHILSLDPSYPTNALAFIGLPTKIANCPSDIVQSLFAVHAILNPSILPTRDVLLNQLGTQEDELRRMGTDPYVYGHYFVNGTSNDYQDNLMVFLKSKNVIPNTPEPFVEQWRRDILEYGYLKRGWKRIEALGKGGEWVKGVSTEHQWSDLMQRINTWQERFETKFGANLVRNNVDLQT